MTTLKIALPALTITLPDRLPGAISLEDRIELDFRRCRLRACQKLLIDKDFCSDRHRYAYHNELRKVGE